MGKKRSRLIGTLMSDIYSYKNLNSATTVDQIITHLQSKSPYYNRTKNQSLKTLIRNALAEIQLPSPSDGGMRKKQKLASEESESDSESGSVSKKSGLESANGAGSISEDAVSPRIDLLRTCLRDSYRKGLTSPKEKNVEMEVPGKEKKTAVMRDGEGEIVKGLSERDFVVGDGNGPRFKDIGGMEKLLEQLKREIMLPLQHPELLKWFGVRPISGVLLTGPPGCGKTMLAHAIANEAGLPFYSISPAEIVSGVSGGSEENIRDIFSKAQRTAPSIVFIDEIDAIASKRENAHKGMECRIVSQLLTCMNESYTPAKPTVVNSKSESIDSAPGFVLVIGATNTPDALDPAFRRPGRFDREIALGVPDENARAEILSVLTKNVRLEDSFDLLKVAKSTPGFVGTDLNALVNEAGSLAMIRSFGEVNSQEPFTPEEMENHAISMQDFEGAIPVVQPSTKREGFSSVPDVTWDNVGGLDDLRKEFGRYITRRIKYPKLYESFGMNLATGFLLYGPPGCGKTMIAKAVANESGANFIYVKGPELLTKYVGDSELAVRTVFSRARTCAPCVIFFDEVEALATKRGIEGEGVVGRVVNQLLIELDGAEQRRGIYVIGATNRPGVIDKALIRPGRLGKQLYVPLPTVTQRGLILRAVTREMQVDPSVDFDAIARMKACKHFSGADLANLASEATMVALEEESMSMESIPDDATLIVKTSHFEQVLAELSPSVTTEQRRYYKNLSSRTRGAKRARGKSSRVTKSSRK